MELGVISAGSWIIIIFFVIIPILLFIIALIDVLGKTFRTKKDKFIWIAVILIFPVLGAILYFLIGRPRKISG